MTLTREYMHKNFFLALLFLPALLISCGPDGTETGDSNTSVQKPSREDQPPAAASKTKSSVENKPPPPASNRIVDRISPPRGYDRVQLEESSFGHYLRSLKLKPGRPPVYLHDGSKKNNQSVHHTVVDIDVGKRDLQQCADAVIRLRAEYLFHQHQRDDLMFRFTSGDPARWSRWADGDRPRVHGNSVSWQRTASPDRSYDNFRSYLNTVFTYAGSASLDRDLDEISFAKIAPGDVLIEGGFPGHAVLVADAAKNDRGERVFLLLQSFMPAQDIHVLKNFEDPSLSPWYHPPPEGQPLKTPEWTFQRSDLHRWPKK